MNEMKLQNIHNKKCINSYLGHELARKGYGKFDGEFCEDMSIGKEKKAISRGRIP